ncbi:carboxypeptidase-like regulatory domain-containing protein [Kordia sp.]|uniref:carboxypeptidase-like regulatory domain-containing protein n=1 Tax=Kordia sp. TaxID=1965332 RepID=UPI003D6B4254
MKTNLTFIISFLFTVTAFAQYEITVDAYILDKETKEPIPYANVEFLDKDLKAVTDAEGKFTLTFDEELISDKDRFQIVTSGYHEITVEMSKLSRYLSVTDKIYLTESHKKSSENTIKGKVATKENGIIQNATISVKNTFLVAQTDVNGMFEIPAQVGDVLVVDYLGMHEKEILVTDTNAFDIELTPNAELLSTVMIKGKKPTKKKQYVDTGFGKVSLNTFSLGTVITSDNIGSQHIYVTDVLRGSVAGLFVNNGESNIRSRFNRFARRSMNPADGSASTGPGQPVISLRGTAVQVFYDGFPYYGNINEIEIRSIDNIVVLKSMASTIIYGGRPTILITSKNRFLKKDENGRVINDALLTNNNYEETVPLLSNNTQKASYLKTLETAKSYDEALAIYQKQQQNNSLQTIPYYMDTAEYFKRWNAKKSIEILQTIEKLAYNNPTALKALAYKLEEQNQFEKAKLIYQRIALLLPNAAQSYRDLALAYKRTGNYQESLDLYVKMLTNSYQNIDFAGLEKTLMSEMQQLLRRHRSEVDYNKIPSNLLTTSFKYDVRVVFEWNKSDTEFELQFVNPTSKFYTWKHSLADNKERMFDEVKNGYHSEEFIIDDAENAGEWIVNVKNLNKEKAFNPTYLKYTLYTNYGKSNEERTIKVVKLYQQQQKITLDKINYQSQQSSATIEK